MEGPCSECNRREDAPIWVVDRHVFIEQAEAPNDDGSHDIGPEQGPIFMKDAVQLVEGKTTCRSGDEINNGDYDDARRFFVH